jgi:hypothetical protein
VKSSILSEPWPQYGIGNGGNGLSLPRPEDANYVAFGKTLLVTRTDRPAEYLNIDPSGLEDAGYGPETK